MAYRIAGVDVHKKRLAVAVADVEVTGEWRFDRRQFGTSPGELRALAAWLQERQVEEVVMESTAQYWRPVWDGLERDWQPARRARAEAGPTAGALHLAQAQSNQGPRGRKQDFPDAERLVNRLVAQELILSFVPDVTQRLWRTVTRRKYQLTCNRVQLQNRLECLLEEMHIKLSSLVTDLLGPSGVDSAQQIIAEVGPTAATFATAKRLASWVGACPGHDESAGINHSRRPPHGNRQRRRLLNQAANAAVKTKGSLFELVYRRLVVRLGHAQAIGAIAHRLCRLVWKILHDGVTYDERGPSVTKARAQRRAAKLIRELRTLGYRVEPSPASTPA
jgi:transposase